MTGLKKCPLCEQDAVRKVGRGLACLLHYRIKHMRYTARQAGKSVPTIKELESLFASLDGMKCPHCRGQMRLHSGGGPATGDVVSLQHDRSGAVRLLCLSCNAKHALYEGDSFYGLPVNPDAKACTRCREIKPIGSFRLQRKRVRSLCRQCEHEVRTERRRRKGVKERKRVCYPPLPSSY